jgi:hypothetical protein
MKWIRWSLPLLVLLIICSQAFAEEQQEVASQEPQKEVVAQEDNKIAVSLTYGFFSPTDSGVKDTYSDTWTRLALRAFQRDVPKRWRIVGEVGSLSVDGSSDVKLIPVTIGIEKGFRQKKSFQPYFNAKAGPYYGNVDNNITGTSKSSVGLSANAAYGVVIKKTFFVEARYDYFTEIADTNFSGFSLSAGVRLFDLRL